MKKYSLTTCRCWEDAQEIWGPRGGSFRLWGGFQEEVSSELRPQDSRCRANGGEESPE